MTFVIAAAGTGGHVFPGLAVGEALVDRGVPRSEVLYVGGSRLEATVYPDEGFPFLGLEIRGLKRSMSAENLSLARVIRQARNRLVEVMTERGAKATLGMGGYITVPTAMAARRLGVAFFNSEQNARAGLANRVTARWARQTFGSFPITGGLPNAVWAGNPVREPFWRYDRNTLRTEALRSYGLGDAGNVVGVVGGSLGSAILNQAVSTVASKWEGPEIQILHLTGERYEDELQGHHTSPRVTWVRRGFETSMESFYAATDLVVTRAGGAVAELTATSTPSILVPGDFGSRGHQSGNARFLTEAGAAVTVVESELPRLGEVIAATLRPDRLVEMRDLARRVAKPRAAHTIADAMIEAAK